MRPASAPRRLVTALLVIGLVSPGPPAAAQEPGDETLVQDPDTPQATNPILFVTQVPIPGDFTAIASVFGNHRTDMDSVGRGGDLWIRYPNGNRKNLTAAAGYGVAGGFQGGTSIAVREPSVHWDGQKALFSMVIGAPPAQYQYAGPFYWQLYEVTGLGETQTPVITKVPNQPPDYNNVSPLYGSDDRIIFSSDRPRNGQRHLWPQLDEYEEAPTVTGLWSLDPQTADLRLLDHAPSGDFTPILDSFGRLIFTRWDHLQRDQQADADAGGADYGTFNYASEAANAARLDDRTEVFPEPRAERTDLLRPEEEGHSFNHFFPWEMNEDGTALETLNHIGRHELHSYFNRAFNDDPNLDEFIDDNSGRVNPNPIEHMLQVKEKPTQPGLYVGIDAPEFYTHASGQVVTMTGAPTQNTDQMTVGYVTHRATAGYNTSGPPPANHSGHYRDPLPLADGTIVVSHTTETRLDQNEGTRALPVSRYKFRLKTLTTGGNGYQVAGAALTSGIFKTLWYWDPDVRVDYVNVEMWELHAVEVRARPRPPRRVTPLASPEQAIFAQEGVDPLNFQQDLRARNIAALVSRNVTTRDDADKQQPFNLRVPGGAQTIGLPGRIYDVSYVQFYQADQIRGLGGVVDPRDGRRVLAQVMHDPAAVRPPAMAGPLGGSLKLSLDGSMAAFVPARRAMSWHLTAPNGTPVTRERYWLTFQPGEIRTCASCHGVNDEDQAGQLPPPNPPEALRQLVTYWRDTMATGITASAPSPASEGSSGVSIVSFNVALQSAAPGPVSVQYATADGTATAGSDYTYVSGTVDFPVGVTARTVQVPVFGDRIDEGNETFSLVLSSPMGGVIRSAPAQATIVDDDAAGLAVSDIVAREGRALPATARFTVTLTPPAAGTVTVLYGTGNGTALAGSDYTNTSGMLTFTTGQSSKTVDVAVLPDTALEGPETFTLNLASPTGGPSIAYNQGTASLLDASPGGDLTADNQTDILWQHPVSGRLVWWAMNGITRINGGFTIPNSANDDPLWRVMGTSDFNVDGKTDFLLHRGVTGEVFLWHMNGITLQNGTLTTPPSQNPLWRASATADFNADGKPDILWRHGTTGQLRIWTMNGAVRLQELETAPNGLADLNWRVAGAGDFNADGKPDILWRHAVSGRNVAWLMDGTARISGSLLNPDTVIDTNWQMAGVGDFNSDAKPDILWRHLLTSKLVVWLMDGLVRTDGLFTDPPALADPQWQVAGPR